MSYHVSIISNIDQSPNSVPPPSNESQLLQLPIELLIDIVTALDTEYMGFPLRMQHPLLALRL